MANIEIINPSPQSVFRGSIQTFKLSFQKTVPEESWLFIGTSKGGYEYASVWVGSKEEVAVDGLRIDGSDIYIRFWYLEDGSWNFIDQVNTAASEENLPYFVSPVPQGILNGSEYKFEWNFNGLEPKDAWLYVEAEGGVSQFGKKNSVGIGDSTVLNLPVSGEAIRARLFFQLGDSWFHVDETFTAFTKPIFDLETSTKELQEAIGVVADGDIGPITLAAFNKNWVGNKDRFDKSFAGKFTNNFTVVKWIQTRISEQGGPQIIADGLMGPATDDAITSHLGRGGIVAAESFRRLLEESIL